MLTFITSWYLGYHIYFQVEVLGIIMTSLILFFITDIIFSPDTCSFPHLSSFFTVHLFIYPSSSIVQPGRIYALHFLQQRMGTR